MVPLEDFIAAALADVVRGIRKGQSTDVGDHIAPLIQGEKRNDHGNFHLKDDPSNQATIVQFDVQVSTDSHVGVKGKAGAKFRLWVTDSDLSGEGSLTEQSSRLHRLQFAIPIKIPRGGSQTG